MKKISFILVVFLFGLLFYNPVFAFDTGLEITEIEPSLQPESSYTFDGLNLWEYTYDGDFDQEGLTALYLNFYNATSNYEISKTIDLDNVTGSLDFKVVDIYYTENNNMFLLTSNIPENEFYVLHIDILSLQLISQITVPSEYVSISPTTFMIIGEDYVFYDSDNIIRLDSDLDLKYSIEVLPDLSGREIGALQIYSIGYDGEGYWFAGQGGGSDSNDIQRFYRIDPSTGLQDRVLNYEPLGVRAISVENGKFNHFSTIYNTTTTDFDHWIFQIDLTEAIETSLEEEFFIPFSVMPFTLGLVIIPLILRKLKQ